MADPTETSLSTRIRPLGSFLLGTAFLMRLWIAGGAAGLGTNTFIHTLFLTGAFLLLLSTLRNTTYETRFSGIEIPLTLFLALGVISLTWTSYTIPTMQSALAYLSFALFGFSLFQLFQNRPHPLFTCLLGFLFVLCLYCLIQKYILLPEARQMGALDTRFQGSEMAARLSSVEVFGTFLYPNSLAGFLVLTLPIVGGMIFDLKRFRWAGGALFLLGGGTLFFTGSLGGWFSFALALLLLAALLLTRNHRHLRKGVWVLSGGGVILVLGLVITGPLAPSRIENESMRIRSVYWETALHISEDHLWTGVGLDNFQEYYPAYKGTTQQETRKVHNDYLQILVELGIPGIFFFLLMLGWTLRQALPRPKEPHPTEPPSNEKKGLILIGVLSLFLSWLIEGVFGILWASLLSGAWVGFILFWYPLQKQMAQDGIEGTRLGLVAGFCGLLIHMGVDFDLYEFGLAALFFATLFVFPLLSNRKWTFPLHRAASIIFLFLLAAFLFPLLLLLPRLLEADRFSRMAALEKESGHLRLLEAEESTNPLQKEESRLQSDGHFTKALALYQSALEETPFNPDLHIEYGLLCLQLWERIKNSPNRNNVWATRLAVEESRTITAFENARNLRPRSIPAESILAQAHLRFAEHYREESGPQRNQMTKAHLDKALQHARRTITLYPTRSHAYYDTGRILEKSGQDDQAKNYFQKALSLSEQAAKENLERLQLDLFQKSRALYRTGRGEEAHSLLKQWFEVELERSQKGSVPAKIVALESFIGKEEKGETLRNIIGAEFDFFLAPRIISILKEILEDLSPP